MVEHEAKSSLSTQAVARAKDQSPTVAQGETKDSPSQLKGMMLGRIGLAHFSSSLKICSF